MAGPIAPAGTAPSWPEKFLRRQAHRSAEAGQLAKFPVDRDLLPIADPPATGLAA
jgi:hypothetical protein